MPGTSNSEADPQNKTHQHPLSLQHNPLMMNNYPEGQDFIYLFYTFVNATSVPHTSLTIPFACQLRAFLSSIPKYKHICSKAKK